MASDDTVIVVMSVVFGLLPTCVLQATGTYSNHWVSNSTCENIGLRTACCMASNTPSRCVDFELHASVAGMHTFAAVVMLCAVIGTCCSFCCEDSETWFGVCALAGCCGTVLYPVAGLVSFIGCMMLVPKYSGHGYTFGYSYGLCITAGLLVILICVCLISLVCYSNRKRHTAPPSTQSNAVAQNTSAIHPVASFDHSYNQQLEAAVKIEQAEIMATDDESGATYYLKMISISTMVRSIYHRND